jgi:hypothetical protein
MLRTAYAVGDMWGCRKFLHKLKNAAIHLLVFFGVLPSSTRFIARFAVENCPGQAGGKQYCRFGGGLYLGSSALWALCVPVAVVAILYGTSLPRVTWLILPVVICLCQRLSHACVSISDCTARLRTAH